MTVKEAMTNIANKIRDILGINDKIRLTEIPSYIDTVWNTGYSKGQDNGYWWGWGVGVDQGQLEGEQAEYDRFWDAYQQNGNRSEYAYAFAGQAWTDETYNPKYPINATVNANALFANNSQITDTKVPINLGTSSSNKLNMFQYASNIVTIRELIWDSNLNFASQFTSCKNLKNITLNGTITRDINMQWSPLTVESAWNVVQHLKCFEAYPDPESDINPDFMKYTVTFSSAVWEALNEYTRENKLHGWGTVQDYIENEIGWRTA